MLELLASPQLALQLLGVMHRRLLNGLIEGSNLEHIDNVKQRAATSSLTLLTALAKTWKAWLELTLSALSTTDSTTAADRDSGNVRCEHKDEQ